MIFGRIWIIYDWLIGRLPEGGRGVSLGLAKQRNGNAAQLFDYGRYFLSEPGGAAARRFYAMVDASHLKNCHWVQHRLICYSQWQLPECSLNGFGSFWIITDHLLMIFRYFWWNLQDFESFLEILGDFSLNFDGFGSFYDDISILFVEFGSFWIDLWSFSMIIWDFGLNLDRFGSAFNDISMLLVKFWRFWIVFRDTWGFLIEFGWFWIIFGWLEPITDDFRSFLAKFGSSWIIRDHFWIKFNRFLDILGDFWLNLDGFRSFLVEFGSLRIIPDHFFG